MIISCPACGTGYLLPERLLGPGGARVRCPHCQHLFAVTPAGSWAPVGDPAAAGPAPPAAGQPVAGVPEPAGPSPAPEPAAPAAEPAAAAAVSAVPAPEAFAPAPAPAPAESAPSGARGQDELLMLARAVLDHLAAEHGEEIQRARDEHRLFADFGPALMRAFEAYRCEAGAGADAAAFRQALRERWGVELIPLESAAD